MCLHASFRRSRTGSRPRSALGPGRRAGRAADAREAVRQSPAPLGVGAHRPERARVAPPTRHCSSTILPVAGTGSERTRPLKTTRPPLGTRRFETRKLEAAHPDQEHRSTGSISACPGRRAAACGWCRPQRVAVAALGIGRDHAGELLRPPALRRRKDVGSAPAIGFPSRLVSTPPRLTLRPAASAVAR